MQFKKIFIIALAVLAAVVIMIPFVSADEAAEPALGLAVETNVSSAESGLINVGEGDLVEVIFSITDNKGLAGLQFDIEFDPEVFAVIMNTNGQPEVLNLADVITDPFGNNGAIVKVDQSGKIYAQIFFGHNLSVYTGEIFTLNFRVLKTTHGDVEIGISGVHAFVDAKANSEIAASEIDVENAALICHGDHLETRVVEPTCESNGYTIVECNDCNFEFEYNELEKVGHDFSVQVVAPTCLDAGYSIKKCKVCGLEERFDEVAALGHDVVVEEAVAATLFSTGLTEGKRCARCDEIIEKQEIVPSLWWIWLIIAAVVIIAAGVCVIIVKKQKAGKKA